MLKALAIHTNSPVNVDHVVTFFLRYKSRNAGSAVLTGTTTEAESKNNLKMRDASLVLEEFVS